MTTLNIGALNGAERGASDRDGLVAMRTSFAQIASDVTMFGDVPNAAKASAALETAARAMLRELQRSGRTVDDIRLSAAEAAGIGEDTDAAAEAELGKVPLKDATSFDDRMEENHPTRPREYRRSTLIIPGR
ncbi:hypothetical protein [Streptomyces hainanensis]|uniref:Uncharacterized protein n=1 Tax=Streptomyces hainanensis TaxID=402648 RepID=A0A4R4TXP0_9ACTN|nr:hypothetical protein [Streptomyces hainanensis]TDC78959.1 hypothetical protein E1283_03775 [Streptomyces hainanensis]